MQINPSFVFCPSVRLEKVELFLNVNSGLSTPQKTRILFMSFVETIICLCINLCLEIVGVWILFIARFAF